MSGNASVSSTQGLNLVHLSMRRPISVLVVVAALIVAALMSLATTPRDILPSLGIPIIYVAQPYGGMSPAQMESYLTYYYEYHFLYIAGLEHVESKNIQSMALIKLQFHPGTDMSQALSETISYVNRAKSFMPDGTLPPFVMRFDAGSAPIGKLVFSSKNPDRTLGELQNFALNNVRPLFATLPGVSAPPPFGANQRTVVIRVDPEKLKNYSLSPYDVAEAVAQANKIIPSGNIPVDDLYPIVPLNAVVKDVQELQQVPLRVGTYPTVFLKDVATVADSTDIPTGYALVNGKRAVYIPVTKRANASTLTVVDLVKQNLPRFKKALPDDVDVSYEFDQSGYVRRAIGSLVLEGLLGALLTGLMVLLFLRDWRSVLIVVLNIPLALMVAVVSLGLTGQTLNIMTLGGLALAIGILVDETTVTIENIHTHLSRGKSTPEASLDATNEILKPALLTMLCVLAVFIPSFFMVGIPRALFVPLTLAVGFSLIGSFLLSRTLVPVLSTWFLKSWHGHEDEQAGLFARFRRSYQRVLHWELKARALVIAIYGLVCAGLLFLFYPGLGIEIFPQVDVGQFQLRLRAPTGTRIDVSEKIALHALDLIKQTLGDGNLEGSVGFVGSQSPNYAVNPIYLWTSGPQEAVFQVGWKRDAGVESEKLKETLRMRFKQELPNVSVSFEPSGIVDQMMSQGSTTPIQIAISGKDFPANQQFGVKVREALLSLPFLRDVQFEETFDYPSIDVKVDRRKAGLMGLTMAHVGKALVPSTSSSRYVIPNYWSDPKNGINYQVQVEVPQGKITSLESIKKVPVSLNGGAIPLERFAEVTSGKLIGEYDRYNMQRIVSLTANLSGKDLGHAVREIQEKLKTIDSVKPASADLKLRGQAPPMEQMFQGLSLGLLAAIGVILLLLAANFQSVLLSITVLTTVPAVIVGVVMALRLTGTTLNVQSFMGAIMAIGVAVANAILLVTFAERSRLEQKDATKAALEGAGSRLRPILMTSLAMLAGMIPMSLGLGEGGQQSAPLGRAVMGGLLGATFATLLVLPVFFAVIQGRRHTHSISLDPDDPESRYFKPARAR